MLDRRIGLSLLIGSVLLPGCDRPAATSGKPSAGGSASADKPAALPAALFVQSEPAEAKNVIDAKRDVKAGDAIVIRGRIGGSVDPFVSERAIFTIVDRSLPHCGEMSMEDGCKTPWDYCCEPSDKLAEHSATIQITGADGRVLKTDVRNVPALKPTSEIVIKGKVAQREGTKLLVVNAESIYVKS